MLSDPPETGDVAVQNLDFPAVFDIDPVASPAPDGQPFQYHVRNLVQKNRELPSFPAVENRSGLHRVANPPFRRTGAGDPHRHRRLLVQDDRLRDGDLRRPGPELSGESFLPVPVPILQLNLIAGPFGEFQDRSAQLLLLREIHQRIRGGLPLRFPLPAVFQHRLQFRFRFRFAPRQVNRADLVSRNQFQLPSGGAEQRPGQQQQCNDFVFHGRLPSPSGKRSGRLFRQMK